MAQQAAYGTALKVFDIYTALAYVTVAYVRDISGPNLSLDALEDTAHDTSGAARGFLGGLLDAGEVTLDLAWDAANSSHDVLLNLLINRQGSIFQLVWPDTSQDNFRAFVTAFEPSAPVDNLLTANVTLRLNSFPILDDTTGFTYLEDESGEALLTEGGDLILINNAPS